MQKITQNRKKQFHNYMCHSELLQIPMYLEDLNKIRSQKSEILRFQKIVRRSKGIKNDNNFH